MLIAIRKENDGTIYIDKEICSKTQEVAYENGNITIQPLFTNEQLSQPPYNYTKIEIADIYSDCINADFNPDLTFNVEKYNARKEKEKAVEYENKIVALIRERYSINQELAILRQKDTKTTEYNEYYAYVEECKAKVKQEM